MRATAGDSRHARIGGDASQTTVRLHALAKVTNTSNEDWTQVGLGTMRSCPWPARDTRCRFRLA